MHAWISEPEYNIIANHEQVFPVEGSSLVILYIHVNPHQQLHEWPLAIDRYLITADDFNELTLTIDGAAN